MAVSNPSATVDVARANLTETQSIEFHQASVDESHLNPNSQDFGHSVGVLHHVPDTAAAIMSCVKILKSGAPLLLYLYYDFDNRPALFRALWCLSDYLRRAVRHLPPGMKHIVTDIIAATVYWPLARLCSALEKLSASVHRIPLSYCGHHTFYTMRTDSRDPFGTQLEQRFARVEIKNMMRTAGVCDIRFSSVAPYWCAVSMKIRS